ncbi:hypothetical protein D3C73_896780 [compost metagenome]
MFHRNTQLLRSGAVGHALHQQAVDTCLRIGAFHPVKDRICCPLHFGRGAQVEHNALDFRLVGDIRRTQFQGYRVANLLGDMHRFGAVFGNPGWQRGQIIGLQNRLHLVSIELRSAFGQRLLN